MNSRTYGFTLIELIVVVAIVAILVRLAYPSYQDHVYRAKRAEGKAALLKAAQLLERNYVNGDPTVANSTPQYLATGKLALLFGLPENAVIYSGENPGANTGAYTITSAAPAGTCTTTFADCFLLTATPNNNAPANFDDKKPRGTGAVQCGTLTLDSAGRRGIEAGAALTLPECWDR